MNTQGHAVINLAILGRTASLRENLAILVGGVLPDTPIVGFYFWAKWIKGADESDIWGRMYFEVHEYFDVLNSLPLSGLGAFVAHRFGFAATRGFFASIFLHSFVDLWCHNDDAHRHFLPLSTWRFESPVSYWDPAHYGPWFMVFEGLCVVFACRALWKRHGHGGARLAISGVLLLYFVMYVAIATWLLSGGAFD